MQLARRNQFSQQAFTLIERLEESTSVDQVMDLVQGLFGSYGGAKVMLTGIVPKSGQRFSDLVLGSRWPQEFLDLYTERDYLRVDPIAHHALHSARPFEWRSENYMSSCTRARELMRHAADFGLAHGFIVPIHRPEGYEAVAAMAGAKLELQESDKASLHLVALYAFDRVRRLHRDPPREYHITPREREVLAWAADGKSAGEIGDVLDISSRTVEEHLASACRKLRAANRTQAVAIALRARLIG